MVTEQD